MSERLSLGIKAGNKKTIYLSLKTRCVGLEQFKPSLTPVEEQHYIDKMVDDFIYEMFLLLRGRKQVERVLRNSLNAEIPKKLRKRLEEAGII